MVVIKMVITQSNFFSLLSGVKQYQIPIYQRNYAWGKEECTRLLKDIIGAGNPNSPSHYIGSVIVKTEPAAGGVNIFNVIDGQQRTTSISLLLLALEKYYASHQNQNVPATTAAILGNIKDIYLTNPALTNTSLYTKMLLKYTDRNEFDNLIHNVIGNGQISQNYRFFCDELSKGNYDPTVIFNGINNAQLALVTLDPPENPQLLFEAVNDTGKDLTEVDKVRNWIFMGLPLAEQDRLYRSYWQTMESNIGEKLNSFLRYYTIIKMSKMIGNDYYSDFKSTFILQIGTPTLTEQLLRDITNYSELFKQYFDLSFTDRTLVTQLGYIKRTGKDNFTPVVLKILKNNSDNVVNLNDSIRMLNYIESYIVRRDILNIPTNSLNPAMINMLNHCGSLLELEQEINSLPSRQYMPTDAELNTQLKTRNFYGLSLASYYLERIEKHFNPAFSLADSTIEHILPETMHTTANPKTGVSNPDDYNWELDLGANAVAIHDTYQHTLGNLTLLPRSENSRMGDYRFYIKKNWPRAANNGFCYGYLHTPIRISQSLRNVLTWDEAAIDNRCREMVGYICTIWPHP